MNGPAALGCKWLEASERFERLDVARDGTILGRLADEATSDGLRRWCAWRSETWTELRLEQDRELPFSKTWQQRAQAGARLLAWRPGRRAVARAPARERPQSERQAASVVIKAYRRGLYENGLERQKDVLDQARSAGVLVPDWIAAEPSDAVVVFQDLGQVRPSLRAKDSNMFTGLGQSLAALQARPVPKSLLAHTLADELGAIDALAKKVLGIRGELPAGFQKLRDELGAQLLARKSGTLVLTHRDLHDGQLMNVAGRLAILDFDLACAADAALDLSNLSAHLDLRAMQGMCSAQDSKALEAALLAGYGDAGGPDLEARMSLCRRATYLRLALVHSLRPPWSALVAALLDRASHSIP